MNLGDKSMAIMAIAIILMMVIPMPSAVLDLLLV